MIGSRAQNPLHVFVEVRPLRTTGRSIPPLLADARRRAALWVAQAAQECGASTILLNGSRRYSCAAADGNALWVRWGAGALLGREAIRRLGSAAQDGCTWGNRARHPDLWAFPAHMWPRSGSAPQRLFLPTAATMFRLATAGDLCLLAALGPWETARDAKRVAAPTVLDNIRAVTRLLTRRTAELVVVGDPGSEGWRHLEQETACRVRLLGDAPGGLLAHLLASVGAEQFVRYLSELGQAFLINTRILFTESALPAPLDFFYSDLGLVERIAHRGLRSLTDVLMNSDQPSILGGQSLLTGGMYLLIERAWEGEDLPRQCETLAIPRAKPITKE